MSDKSDLLGQLKIDRTPEEKTGVSPGTVVAIVFVVAAMTAFGVLQFLGSDTGDESSLETRMVASAGTEANEDQTDVVAETAAQATPPRVAPSPQTTRSSSAASDAVLNASGYITARRVATVSSKIMGLITDVAVEEGMIVTANQVLAQLDDKAARVELRYAEAQLQVQHAKIEGIEANLAEAERVLTRVTSLKDENFSSEANLTRAQADVESLKASLASARAEIRVAEEGVARQRERLSDHTIRAPFGGVVTVKNAQPGEIVSPSSAGGGFTRTGICTIVDMDSLEIEVDVNEAFIGRVYAGQHVQANLDAYPDWNIPASVIAIIPTADRARATVKVRIQIETNDVRILPEMGVRVAFLKSE